MDKRTTNTTNARRLYSYSGDLQEDIESLQDILYRLINGVEPADEHEGEPNNV